MTAIAKLAAGLTDAQRRVILSLPKDGSFGRSTSHRVAKYMWYGIGKGRSIRLVEHQHLTYNSWCLNGIGLAVREHLEKK